MNKPLEESFALLLGRTPTGEEREQLYKVKDALGIAENDALWLVLMALEYYRALYEKLPSELEKAAKDLVDKLHSVTGANLSGSAETIKGDLTKAVVAAAEQMASRTAERKYIQWIAGSIVAASLSISALAYVIYQTAHRLAYESGYQAGYGAAKDEKAWGNSDDGRLSRRMAREGVLGLVTRCDAPGWTIKNGYCYPGQHGGQVYGWRLPQGERVDQATATPVYSSAGK